MAKGAWRTSRGMVCVVGLTHKRLGRPPKMDRERIEAAQKLLVMGAAPRVIATNFGVSLPTLYRWIPGGRAAVYAASQMSLPLPSPEIENRP